MAGFTVAQPGGYSADLDALLVRRDLFSSGNLWTWGRNNIGQLGNSSTTSTSSAGNAAGSGQTWRQVACSYNFTAAVKIDGTLWTWGNNNFGQLGNNSIANTSSPATVTGGGVIWLQAACGVYHAAAIKTDGTLWTWGRGGSGQLGNSTAVDTSSPGTVAGGGTTWRQVACVSSSTAAIKTDGTLWTWGDNANGSLGNGSTVNTSSPGVLSGVTWSQLSGGYGHMAAIKTDGTLWTWGYNNKGQLGNNSATQTSTPGTVAGGGTTWSSIACGYFTTAAIKTDGTLWTAGLNDKGQLGNGSTIAYASGGQSSFATVAGGGTTWKSVSCSFAISSNQVAIKTDGTLWTWGDNTYGQLGNSTTTDRSSPGTVAGGGTNWKSVVTGSGFTIAITDLST
jgi:hypothetical protein